MDMLRSISRTAALTALSLAAAAASASAQGRPLFAWSGTVDREVLIVMRDRDVDTRYAPGERPGSERTRVGGALPRTDGDVRVQLQEGRGSVEVVQQPSRRNDYTTIVRVRDARSGADRYRVVAYWQPSSYGVARNDGRWDDGTYDDGTYDRGRSSGRGRWGRARDDDRDGRDDRDDRDDRSGRGGWSDVSGGPGALRWSGDVDDAVEIRIQGRRADYVTLSGNGTRNVRTSFVGNALPSRDVQVRIQGREGRGRVLVVQQPTARNGYTAVVRVSDSRSGYGYYDFDATW